MDDSAVGGCFINGLLGDVGDDESWELLQEDGDFKGCTLAANTKIVAMSTRQCSAGDLWNEMPSLLVEDTRFKSLVVLDLHKCRYIDHLHESVCDLPELRKMVLTRCNNLRTLPSNIGNLRNLTEVKNKNFIRSL